MSAQPTMDPSEPSKPTASVCVSKDEASKMKVGSPISLSMTGEVKSIHQSYDDKTQYEVVIEDPQVEVETDEDDESDDNMATMPREKLKEKIKNPESED